MALFYIASFTVNVKHHIHVLIRFPSFLHSFTLRPLSLLCFFTFYLYLSVSFFPHSFPSLFPIPSFLSPLTLQKMFPYSLLTFPSSFFIFLTSPLHFLFPSFLHCSFSMPWPSFTTSSPSPLLPVAVGNAGSDGEQGHEEHHAGRDDHVPPLLFLSLLKLPPLQVTELTTLPHVA